MSPPWGQEPFAVFSHRAQDSFLLPSLLFWPLANDHSSLPHSFIQFLFHILTNYLLIYLRFSRPKAPSPLNEKQKDSLAWLFSQLVPTPPQPPQLSPCASSKTARLCCLTALAQKRPRDSSAALCKWARCDPNMGFASWGGPWARCNPRMNVSQFWCHPPLGKEEHLWSKPMTRLLSSCPNKTSGADSSVVLCQTLVLAFMSLNQQWGSTPVLGSHAKVTAKLGEAGSPPWEFQKQHPLLISQCLWFLKEKKTSLSTSWWKKKEVKYRLWSGEEAPLPIHRQQSGVHYIW